MFETYMEGHSVDPRVRARMMMALMASLLVTTAAGSMGWAAGRLSIGRVGPPAGTDFMQLTLWSEAPLPKADPPPAPAKPRAEDTAPRAAQATGVDAAPRTPPATRRRRAR